MICVGLTIPALVLMISKRLDKSSIMPLEKTQFSNPKWPTAKTLKSGHHIPDQELTEQHTQWRIKLMNILNKTPMDNSLDRSHSLSSQRLSEVNSGSMREKLLILDKLSQKYLAPANTITRKRRMISRTKS